MTSTTRILLVDDSEDARMIALAALEEGDFGTVATADGAEAAYRLLDIADEVSPPAFDCILLDIVMPGIDGVEACAAIRASRRYRDVPIVMVSGLGEARTLNGAFLAGANDYVTKPIRLTELLARVRSALRFKREIDRRRAREGELRARAAAATRSDAGGIDPDLLVADRALVEAALHAAADAEVATAVVALQVGAVAEYRALWGDAAGDVLLRRVVAVLAAVPAPLGATFGRFDDGLFVAVLPATDAAAAHALSAAAVDAIDALRLPHGAWVRDDHVRLDAAADIATGDDLLRLPGELIALLDRQQRHDVRTPIAELSS